jgi:RNA polymerase sigma-70 factor (ECF subfamily)
MSAPEDAALVLSAQAGDPAALGALLERHRALLHAVATGMLGHGPAAEDAVQDAFLIALRRIGDLRRPAAARGWLVAILVNVCRGQLRRPAALPVAEPPERAAPGGGVEEAIERLALRDWVWAALDRLSEPLRLAVVLRHFTPMSSYDAIAEACGVPVGTVRSRLSAARARLADELLAAAADANADLEANRRRTAEVGAAMLALQDDGDRGPLRAVLAPDVRFALADRVQRSGADLYASLMSADFEDGVRGRPTRVIAGARVAVVELVLENPSSDPLHCPPAMTHVQVGDEHVIRRIVTHYAPRPAAMMAPCAPEPGARTRSSATSGAPGSSRS